MDRWETPHSHNSDAYGNMTCTTGGECQYWTYDPDTNRRIDFQVMFSF